MGQSATTVSAEEKPSRRKLRRQEIPKGKGGKRLFVPTSGDFEKVPEGRGLYQLFATRRKSWTALLEMDGGGNTSL